jgi:hypothetical protein
VSQLGATFPLSAGTLTVQGGLIEPPLTLKPGQGANNTTSYLDSSTAAWFTAGQVLSVSASGDAFPPFGPELVTAPAMIALLKPAGIPNSLGNTNYDLATSSDLEVAWSGGEQGADVILRGLTASSVEFYCQWDATIGHGTVPQALLAPLAKQRGTLDYVQQRAHLFTAGSYTIGLYAEQGAGGFTNFE